MSWGSRTRGSRTPRTVQVSRSGTPTGSPWSSSHHPGSSDSRLKRTVVDRSIDRQLELPDTTPGAGPGGPSDEHCPVDASPDGQLLAHHRRNGLECRSAAAAAFADGQVRPDAVEGAAGGRVVRGAPPHR